MCRLMGPWLVIWMPWWCCRGDAARDDGWELAAERCEPTARRVVTSAALVNSEAAAAGTLESFTAGAELGEEAPSMEPRAGGLRSGDAERDEAAGSLRASNAGDGGVELTATLVHAAAMSGAEGVIGAVT